MEVISLDENPSCKVELGPFIENGRILTFEKESSPIRENVVVFF